MQAGLLVDTEAGVATIVEATTITVEQEAMVLQAMHMVGAVDMVQEVVAMVAEVVVITMLVADMVGERVVMGLVAEVAIENLTVQVPELIEEQLILTAGIVGVIFTYEADSCKFIRLVASYS